VYHHKPHGCGSHHAREHSAGGVWEIVIVQLVTWCIVHTTARHKCHGGPAIRASNPPPSCL
jgi:hypothetical protein